MLKLSEPDLYVCRYTLIKWCEIKNVNELIMVEFPNVSSRDWSAFRSCDDKIIINYTVLTCNLDYYNIIMLCYASKERGSHKSN